MHMKVGQNQLSYLTGQLKQFGGQKQNVKLLNN
jgi:hypothetical protein